MAVPKPMRTEFGIHHRLKSCGDLHIACGMSSVKDCRFPRLFSLSSCLAIAFNFREIEQLLLKFKIEGHFYGRLFVTFSKKLNCPKNSRIFQAKT